MPPGVGYPPFPPPEWGYDDVPGGEWPPAHWQQDPAEPPPAEVPHALAPAPVPPEQAEDVPEPAQWPPPGWSAELEQVAPTYEQKKAAGLETGEPPSPSLGTLEQTPAEPAQFPPPAWLTPQEPEPQEPAELDSPDLAFEREKDREAERIEGLSDEDLAAETARIETERQQQAAADAAELERQRQRDIEVDAAEAEKSRARIQKRMSDLETAWQEFGEQEIDTGRWWSSRSTGQKVAAYLSAAIHGWLNPGGQNQALDMMQQMIDRDIQAQRMDLETGRAGLQARQNLLGEMYELTGDMEAAQAASRAASYQSAAREIEAKAAAFDPAGTQYRAAAQAGAEMRARKQAAVAEAYEKMVEAEQERREQERKDRKLALDARKAEIDRRLGWAANARAKERQKLDEAEFALSAQERINKQISEATKGAEKGVIYNPLTAKPMVQAREVFGSDDKKMQEFQESVVGHALFEEKMSELQRLVNKAGGRWDQLSFNDRDRAEALQEELVAAKVKAVSGAAATGAERDAIRKSFPGVKSMFSTDFSDPDSTLNQTRRFTRRELELRMQGMGVPVTRDPATGEYTGPAAPYFNNLEIKRQDASTPPAAKAAREARDSMDYDSSHGGISTGVGERQQRKEAVQALEKLYLPAIQGGKTELETLQDVASDGSVDKKVRREAQRITFGAIEHADGEGAALDWLESIGDRNVYLPGAKLRERKREYEDMARRLGGE